MYAGAAEMTGVRALALFLSCAILSLLLLFLIQRVPRQPGEGEASAIVGVFVQQREQRPERASPQASAIADARGALAQTVGAASSVDGEAGARFWLHGAAGRVAFANAQEYRRCLDAAIEGVVIEGCPPPPAGTSLREAAAARRAEIEAGMTAPRAPIPQSVQDRPWR